MGVLFKLTVDGRDKAGIGLGIDKDCSFGRLGAVVRLGISVTYHRCFADRKTRLVWTGVQIVSGTGVQIASHVHWCLRIGPALRLKMTLDSCRIRGTSTHTRLHMRGKRTESLKV